MLSLRHFRSVIFGALFITASCATMPPGSKSPLLRSADLKSDVTTLETIYRALHPGLHRYLTEAQLTAVFDDARMAFERDRTLADAFLVFTRATAKIKCGHSYPNFFNQNEAISAALFQTPRLPFTFRWLNDELVVTRNFSTNAALDPGWVVEGLNGVPTSEILRAMLPLARADGQNDAKRRASLEVIGEGTLEAFDVYWPLLYPLQDQRMAQLQTRSIDGARKKISVPLQTVAERAKAIAADEGQATSPMWKMAMLPQGIAYVPMPSWVMYRTKWNWKGFIDSMMSDLAAKNVPALIVDLRGNEGGNDVGDEILAHLIDRPMKSRTTVRRVRFETVPTALRPMLDTWDKSFFELGVEAVPMGDGWRELPPDPEAGDVIAPRLPPYRGKVVVLVDASNSSATFQFAATLQRSKRATLVGTPTGGSQRGINGGAFFFARLPRTGIEVDVPLIGTFALEANAPDEGITPEVLVTPTAVDIAHRRDPQLERAIERAGDGV